MSLLKVNEVQNFNGSSLTLTASTVSTSAQLNTGGNISVTGSLNVSDDSTTRSNLGLGSIATQASDNIAVTGGTATLGALTVSGSDSGDLVRITQTGSGNALVVEDSANPDSTPFVVDASGNVGIQTSAPVAPLQIDSNAAGDTPLLRLNNKNNTNGDTCNILFGFAGNDNANKGGIFFKRTNSFGRGDLIFATENSTSNDNVDNSDAKLTISSSGSVSVAGSFSKGSGSFKINHPLPSKSEHYLVHSFIEGPQADLIYRGKSQLVNGLATVNIDSVSGMTEGTFVLLNRDVQCFTSNESGWINVRGSVSGNILTIEAEDNTSTDTISWLIIGERQDQHMYDTEWTDENGKVIVEPLKEIEALETTP